MSNTAKKHHQPVEEYSILLYRMIIIKFYIFITFEGHNLNIIFTLIYLSFYLLLKGMGMSWLAQVRCVHLVMFAVCLIPLFVCLSYLNNNQLHTTASPLRTYEVRLVQTSSSNLSQSDTEGQLPPAVPSHSTNATTNNTNQGPDLTKGK